MFTAEEETELLNLRPAGTAPAEVLLIARRAIEIDREKLLANDHLMMKRIESALAYCQYITTMNVDERIAMTDAARDEALGLVATVAALQAKVTDLDRRLTMMTDLRDSYRKGGTMEHVRANQAEAKVAELERRLATEEAERIRCRDGWARAQTDQYVRDAALEDLEAFQDALPRATVLGFLAAHPERTRAGLSGLTLCWGTLEKIAEAYRQERPATVLSERLAAMTDLRDAYRKAGQLEHERAAAAEAEVERLWCESWGMAVLAQACREDALRITRGAMKTMDGMEAELAMLRPSGRVAEDVARLTHSLSSEMGLSLIPEDGAALTRLATKAEGYEAAVADNAELVGELHGLVDDMHTLMARLVARGVQVSFTPDPRLAAALAQPHPGAARLERCREQEQAVQPFLELARERLARRSYEPIPQEACARLLKAFDAAPGEEQGNG